MRGRPVDNKTRRKKAEDVRTEWAECSRSGAAFYPASSDRAELGGWMPSIDQDSALDPSPTDLSDLKRKSEAENNNILVSQHRSDDVVVLSCLMDVALQGPKRDNDMVSVTILLRHHATMIVSVMLGNGPLSREL